MTLFKKHPEQNQPNKNILTTPQEDVCGCFFVGYGAWVGGVGLCAATPREKPVGSPETSPEVGGAPGELQRGPRRARGPGALALP